MEVNSACELMRSAAAGCWHVAAAPAMLLRCQSPKAAVSGKGRVRIRC